MGEWVGDPEKEEDFLKERSPITYVDNIKSTINLLIIQGANNPKVVKNESDQIIERLRDKGIGVEYMVFDDEGHGFTKASTWSCCLKILLVDKHDNASMPINNNNPSDNVILFSSIQLAILLM